MKLKNKQKVLVILFIVASFMFVLSIQKSIAQPTGVIISENITETSGSTPPDDRTDAGGTITTLIIDVLQPNPRWKAYIGNLTGVLSLDDADGQSIFRWELEAEDVTGTIFISRANTLDWGSVDCPTPQEIADEDSTLGFSSSAADSINRTFIDTHPSIFIGVAEHENCPATSTYVNNAPQVGTPDFPLVLLYESTNMIYATPVNKDSQSFNSANNVDFQAIVPDQTVGTTTYYFYAEIGA